MIGYKDWKDTNTSAGCEIHTNSLNIRELGDYLVVCSIRKLEDQKLTDLDQVEQLISFVVSKGLGL